MKKLSCFALIAALLCVSSVRAEDTDSARAATRGAVVTNQSTQRTETREQRTIPQSATSTKSNQQVSARNATPRSTAAATTRTAVTPVQTREISSRSAVQIPGVSTRNVTPVSDSSVGRSAKVNMTRTVGTSAKQPVASRSATVARAGTTTARTTGTPASGYKVCRETFFECMDEFCANKDAQLKRCACSARIHDFDAVRKQLNDAEEKMLDFNERLLSVSMDKEDAVAMSTATEGELAYQQEDNSESKSMLDSIMDKLKSANAETESSNSLATINLSLDTNVFDTVDSQLGIETAAKEGEDLYNAALPTCLEMANEVCAEDEISTVQNAYVASIEQDCNTVKKTYDSLKDAAAEKIREGSALLDMSRLNNQQTRNSDDVLTCKKKMLEALSDSAVCGEDLSKCLDWSGKYINPLTGSAILTSDLNQLNNMIRRPTGTEKWVNVGTNDKFVTFLESKKKYIEPAMKNCESLESTVWASFLEDALAQIKLAQGQKLEDMRQSCTTLTTECMTSASDSLVDFDSRALSIFGIEYDKNVNEVCADIQTACTVLMNGEGTDAYWGEAIGDIATAKTLDQVITTCTEVGKNCIIRNCMNLESKFGLCLSETSVMRTNILTHNNSNPCWDEVLECVESTGYSTISKIMTDTGRFGTEVFPDVFVETFSGSGTMTTIYSRDLTITTATQPTSDLYLWCSSDANTSADICRIAERIWGNCNENPTTGTGVILDTGLRSESLLAWFAENTIQSCNGRACNPGEILSDYGCTLPEFLASDASYCPAPAPVSTERFNIIGDSSVSYTDGPWDGENWTNCCAVGNRDGLGNCCADAMSTVTGYGFGALPLAPPDISMICSENDTPSEFITMSYISITGYPDPNVLVCVGGSVNWDDEVEVPEAGSFPNGDTATCSGKLVVISTKTGLYLTPIDGAAVEHARAYYNLVNGQCVFSGDAVTPEWIPTVSGEICDKISGNPTDSDNNLFINYL